MRTLLLPRVTAVLVLGSGTVALAEGTPMKPPTPAPEVAQAAKDMGGSWKCEGKVPESPMGPAHAVTGTMTWKLDLDKFWLMGNYAEKRTKQNPMPYKFVEHRTFDTTAKKWHSVSVDNMGGWVEGTAGAPDGNKVTWEGKGYMGGMTMTSHAWEEHKSPKEMHVWGEMSMDGKKYMPAFDVTCKRAAAGD